MIFLAELAFKSDRLLGKHSRKIRQTAPAEVQEMQSCRGV